MAWTSGNPFFTEEVVQTLVEVDHLEGTSGAYRLTTAVDELDVPASPLGEWDLDLEFLDHEGMRGVERIEVEDQLGSRLDPDHLR